jgi:hypothetical protein
MQTPSAQLTNLVATARLDELAFHEAALPARADCLPAAGRQPDSLLVRLRTPWRPRARSSPARMPAAAGQQVAIRTGCLDPVNHAVIRPNTRRLDADAGGMLEA